MGDFNIDLNYLNKDKYVKEFFGKFIELGLSLCITHPTQMVVNTLQGGNLRHSNTLIDNIMSTKLYNTTLLPWSVTNHLPIAVNDLFTLDLLAKKKRTINLYKKDRTSKTT